MTEMTTLQAAMILAIVGGNFSAAGNYSGYTVTGQRIHIPGRQMTSLGFTKDEEVKFPLFVNAIERTFDVLDDNQKPTGEKFTRLQAGSTFTSKQTLFDAINADKLLVVESQVAFKKAVADAGLADTLNEVISASVA